MLPVDEITYRPTMTFLSREDKEKIHRAVLEILSEIGMKVHHDEAVALLKDAGCSVAADGMVRIAVELVLEATVLGTRDSREAGKIYVLDMGEPVVRNQCISQAEKLQMCESADNG